MWNIKNRVKKYLKLNLNVCDTKRYVTTMFKEYSYNLIQLIKADTYHINMIFFIENYILNKLLYIIEF